MKITIQGYLTYQSRLGLQQIEMQPGSTLQDLMGRLPTITGALQEEILDSVGSLPGASLVVMLNGVHLRHLAQREKTVLQDGDKVAIFPPVAGG